MKIIKIFLMTSLLLVVIALGAVGYVWVKFQQNIPNDINTMQTDGIKIDTTALSDEQKALAEKVGIDLDELVITQEMISCAEQKVGAKRADEIANGDSPTTLESVALLGCL